MYPISNLKFRLLFLLLNNDIRVSNKALEVKAKKRKRCKMMYWQLHFFRNIGSYTFSETSNKRSFIQEF